MGKIPFSEFDLSGKVAIVTGAGKGMGYHISGHRTCSSDRRRLDCTLKDSRGHGVNGFYMEKTKFNMMAKMR